MAVFTSIGVAAATALGLAEGTLGFTIISGATAAALQIAAGIAVSQIGKALAGDQSKTSPNGVKTSLHAGGDVPRSLMFGYSATAGSLVYANEWGTAGGTPNAYFTQVICLSDYPVDSLAQVWVEGSLCNLGGTPHASYGYPVLEFREDGKDYLWVKFYDGTQTVADSFLTGTVASTERPYPSTRVGTGCAYAIVTSLVNENLFSGFPSVLFALNGAKLYDISKDSTAGGTGTQRWSNPATWGGDGDHLPVVQIYNVMRGITYGGDWLYGLQGMPSARLPDAEWVAQTNRCRATITGPDGAEASYRSGGEIAVNVPIAQAIESMLTACQGRIAEAGGVYKPHVGAYDAAASLEFTDDAIISTEEQSFTPFFGLADTVNGIAATYPSPAEGWQAKSAPALYRADYEALDGARRLMADVSLDMVPYKGQAQRLMKSALQESRRARRHTFVLPPEAFALEPGDVVSWTSDRNGYIDKLFRVDGISDRANLDVMVDITEVDPSDYDWNQGTDYTEPLDGPVLKVTPAPQSLSGWSVAPYTYPDSAGTGRRVGVQVSYAGGLHDIRGVRIQAREAFGSNNTVLDTGEQVYDLGDADPVERALTWNGILPNTDYEVRGILVPESGRQAEWSSWLPVTTADARFGAGDIADGAVTITAFADTISAPQVVDALVDAIATEGALAVLTTDGRLYRYHSGAWTLEIPANVLSGQVVTSQIAAAAITANELASAAVTNVKLAALAVATANIQVAAVTSAIIANDAVQTANIAALAITTAKINTAAITANELASGAVTNVKLAALAVATANIQVAAVTSTIIANNAVQTANIAALAVTAAQVANATLTGTQIAAATIAAGNIVSGTITTTQIATGTIVASNIAANTITAAKIAAGTITTTEIAAGTIVASNIAASTITGANIAAATITGDKVVASSITARELIIADYSNIIPDNDFQNFANTWTDGVGVNFSSIQVLTGSSITRNGRYLNYPAGLINAASTNVASAVSGFIPIEPGKEYAIGGEVALISGATGDMTVNIQWLTAANAQVSQPTVATQAVVGVNTFSAILTPPATAVKARIVIIRHSTGANVASVGIGQAYNFYLRKATSGSLMVDGTVTATQIAASTITTTQIAANTIVAADIAAGTITTTQIAASTIVASNIAASTITGAKIAASTITGSNIVSETITARELILTDYSNVLPDADLNFVGSTSYWTDIVGANRASVTTSAGNATTRAGNLMLFPSGMVNAASATVAGVRSLLVPCGQGDTYAFGGIVVCQAGVGNFYMDVQWYNTAGAVVTTTALGAAAAGGSDTVADIVTVPANAVSFSVRFYRISSGVNVAATGLAYAYNVYVRKAQSASLIVDGTITAAKIAANTITASNIAANTLTAATIAAGAIGATQLAANAVTAGKINAGAISTSSLIVDGVVITAKIADAAVTDPISSISSSGTFPSTPTPQTLESIIVTTGNYPIPVGAYADWTVAASAASKQYFVQLGTVVGGTGIVLQTVDLGFLVGGNRTKTNLSGIIPPLPAGSYTVTLTAWTVSGSGALNHVINYTSLAAGSVKK